jgi:hypothetical protein
MAISKNEVGLLVVGLAIAVVFGYVAFLNVEVETYPDTEIAIRSGINQPVSMAPHEFVTPGNSISPVIYMPHRYPNVSGGNITALIHHGMEPLRKRAPSDSKWIECPPAEVMY